MYATPISPLDREQMTVCPPPLYDAEGNISPYPDDMLVRYSDIASMKGRMTIHVCDEMDVAEWETLRDGGMPLHLVIRCMSCDADLRVILAAAVHLGFIREDFVVSRQRRQGIDPKYIAEFVDVSYNMPISKVDADMEHTSYYVAKIDYRVRRRIWQGLFESMGYRVKFDDALNIRRVSI